MLHTRSTIAGSQGQIIEVAPFFHDTPEIIGISHKMALKFSLILGAELLELLLTVYLAVGREGPLELQPKCENKGYSDQDDQQGDQVSTHDLCFLHKTLPVPVLPFDVGREGGFLGFKLRVAEFVVKPSIQVLLLFHQFLDQLHRLVISEGDKSRHRLTAAELLLPNLVRY